MSLRRRLAVLDSLAGCVLTGAILCGMLASRTSVGQDKPANPAKPAAYVTPAEAAADPDFALQGEYLSERFGVQVVAQGKGKFRTLTLKGGLPGAGWNETDKQVQDDDTAEDVKDLLTALGAKKVERKSPTLGATAPEGAIVLFDGTKETLAKHWKPETKIGPDGLLLPHATTLENFTDYQLHVEFQIPFMPEARGQGRGNSGLYNQGRYEAQMLDSFGLEPKDNECGGLYTIKAADVNACFPPLSWQTYDVEFTAARWSKDGKEKLSNARTTVRLNGILIQNDVELPHTTTAAPVKEDSTPGPIYLQDHGNPVRYKNIWIVPRSAEQEARRPIVAGFERFQGTTAAEIAQSGRLLLGELNCVACHKAEEAVAAQLSVRQAPILDEVGKRIHPEYLEKFLAAPHAVKPGTTMPDLLADLPETERVAAVKALVNFLSTTGSLPEQESENRMAQHGQQLYHQVGCTACHAPRMEKSVATRVSVPLGDLKAKYSIPSLAAFLQDPHKVRPSGRMPGFALEGKDFVDLAHFLIGEVRLKPRNPNLTYSVYEGNWNQVPDFGALKPIKTGQCSGLDLNVANRTNNFGVRFDGFLKLDKDGDYTFHLGSDDGSLLFIDGKKVVDSDGVHPHTENTGRVRLKAGVHPLRVDFFQGGGEWTVTLEYEGPGIPRQELARNLWLTAQGNPNPEPVKEGEAGFQFDPSLVGKGQELFGSLGCANCHQLKVNGQKLPGVMAKALKDLDLKVGCLSNTSAAPVAGAKAQRAPVPRFDLNLAQRTALKASAGVDKASNQSAQAISQAMTTFNCYACHSRDGKGGPERDRNPLFVTTIPEMGDEGRVPPPLDGVGDKLNDAWLRQVLGEGAKDRPYMLTRMPKFGLNNVQHLIPAFVTTDRRTDAVVPPPALADSRMKAVGRQLVGEKALGCIKCHSFGPHRATGIQAINLQTMTTRLREDWFHRYMLNPEAYRPGTRMPGSFSGGVASVKDVLDGHPGQQISAMWRFLKDGDQASLPEGLVANVIELKPESEPIIYRNFIEGLSPRGIAVGYPELAHLAWDADTMSLALLWHGRFIDAGKHWEGRGPGFQRPLGDHVMPFEKTAALATLNSGTEAWPTGNAKDRGYRFAGYELDAQGRPHFRYKTPDYAVEDFPEPVAQGKEGLFRRHIMVTATKPLDNLYFRAATGQTIEIQSDGSYLIDKLIRIGLPNQMPIIREADGHKELLVPLQFKDGKAGVMQEIVW